MFFFYYNQYFPKYPTHDEDGTPLEIPAEVLELLRQSDRKIKHQEYDLKREIWKIDLEHGIARYIGSREDSLDRLLEDGGDFADHHTSVEDMVVQAAMLEKLRQALGQLSEQERWIIQKIFYEGKSQRDVAKTLGITQPRAKRRCDKALQNLRKIMEAKK